MIVELLIGMIGSGKTRYAKTRARQGAIIVAHDDLTEAFHGEYRYEKDLRAFYRAAEERIAALALEAGRDVVIDRTHLTREARTRWTSFLGNRAMHGKARKVAVVFAAETPEVHAARRYGADPRGRTYHDWLSVAARHRDEFEPIDYRAEGFDAAIMMDRSGHAVPTLGDVEIPEDMVW